MTNEIDMKFFLLNQSHSHLLTRVALERVRQLALRHYWLPNSIVLHQTFDQSENLLEFSLITSDEHFFLVIPWNVDEFQVQCHISCQTLANDGYAWTLRMLDRILRLLCDHCPGLFQLEYKNGLFGRQPNRAIIYNGLAGLDSDQYAQWKQRVELQHDRLYSPRDTTRILADIQENHPDNDCGLRSIRYQTLGHGRILNESYYDWFV